MSLPIEVVDVDDLIRCAGELMGSLGTLEGNPSLGITKEEAIKHMRMHASQLLKCAAWIRVLEAIAFK
jgi:hypothetical protein